MINRRRVVGLLLGLAVVWHCRSDAGSDTWPVARGPSREPAPFRYETALWKQVPIAFLEDASACILYYGTTHRIDADGTIETITHDVTRLNGRKGIEWLGEYRNISYDPAYQKLTLHLARIHKADGQVVEIAPKHVHLRDGSSDADGHSPEKQLVISFPNLQVGDTIEVKWTIRGKNPEHMGQFFARHTFDDPRYPVVCEEVRVRLPRDKELKHATINGQLQMTSQDQGDFRLYTWKSVNRPPLPRDNDLPSREELRLQLALSTFASWEDVGKWKERLRAHCWTCTPEIRQAIQQVTKDCKTPLEKARALTTWVRQNIRYLSSRHGYTPHEPRQVLANRFGDCKDQTQLLAVMLQEIGLRVYLVTLGTQDNGHVIPDVPSPWGTHALLLVRIDGRDHWIDTTLTNAPWDFLTLENRDRVVYLTHGEAIGLARTPKLTHAENRFEQTTHVTVRMDGTTHARRSLGYLGSAAYRQRQNWLEVPPGERRRLMTSVLQDSNSRSRLLNLIVDDNALGDFERPVHGEVEFEIPRHFSGDPEREGSFTDSHVWNRLLAYTLDYDRKVPMDLGSPFESRHGYVITIPPAYRFDGVPRERVVRSRWGTFAIHVRRDEKDPHRLQVAFHTRLEHTRVEPADFAAYRTFHEDVNKYWRVWLTLAPTQDLADAPLLEVQLALAPADKTTATILARLYERNGNRAGARRVLWHARLMHPNDISLWEASVKLAANPAEEEQLYAEMVRRFPVEQRHAVAQGAALIKLSEFASAQKVLEPLTQTASSTIRGQAHYHLARSSFLQKEPAEALQHLAAAQQLDPESFANTRALLFKASIHEQFGQFPEAIQAYQQVLKLDADSEDALGSLVRLCLAGNQRSVALDYLRRYTVVVGKQFNGLLQAAEWHLQLGRQHDAFELASRARAQQFNADVHRILGLVHLERGEFAKAVFHLDRADRDAKVISGLIRGYLALGKLSEAKAVADAMGNLVSPPLELKLRQLVTTQLVQRREDYLKMVRATAKEKHAWSQVIDSFLCAEHAHATGRPRPHVELVLSGAFDGGFDFGPAYALRSQLWLEQGRLTKAAADVERALKLTADDPRAFLVRGRIRLERENPKAALADLNRAAELTRRKDAVILHWLAAAQFQTGKRADAVETQRAAVQLRPRDAELAEQLREFERGLKPKE